MHLQLEKLDATFFKVYYAINGNVEVISTFNMQFDFKSEVVVGGSQINIGNVGSSEWEGYL